MTHLEQLNLWVSGESVHNSETDECCPDFSCCQPKLLAEESVRKRFQQAYEEDDEDTVYAILGMFLSKAASLASEGRAKVHIAGDPVSDAN